ncbi:hypothetical protein L5515_016126 [Caenorhabditis briggsae]|uniref:Uncharacterized protein n=1 Tax=Caenorhabditis briggsae TaxID=6238 RepID=A0AAE9FBB6_CAEBR|nr:hypothetical protein L3Y34_010236 [Caenorhabditis briggsae]UMM38796.1 hypothetical protein L5515_016126 [Caenorhabditis briggsae]
MLLAFLLLLVPLAVDSKLPPFFLGKINGQTVLNHHLNRHLVTDGASVFDDYPYLQVHNFTQKLDHFDRYNTKTWNQKYFYNPKYSRNNSIIFLMIGGEGPENGRWAAKPEVQYLQWASEFGADVFDLEHRFFGDSWPISDMETSSLQYLTTQQALADLAYFIESMNQKYGFKNPRWVTFGGSYPGSLSAWFRQKYPELTVGSVASSAPVNLKLDFYEYAMVVEDDLKLTDPQCAPAVRDAFTKIQQMSLTAEGRNSLNTYFNLQPPFDAKTTKLDINNFFGNLFNTFQGMTQYTYDGQSNSTHSDKTVRKMCQIMTNATEPNTVKRVENLFLWFNQMEPAGPDLSVMPNSYWDVIAQVGSGNLTVLGEGGAAARGWMWLCCNEIGFLQTTNQGNNAFGTGVPLNLFIDMCTDMFGDSMKIKRIMSGNKLSQNYYGGADFYNATNVVLPNGSLDPWHALGTYKTNDNQNLLPYLINGTAHCGDMYASYDGEPASLPAARAFIKQHVREFIRYNPAVDGPKGSAAFQSVFFVFSLLAFLILQ